MVRLLCVEREIKLTWETCKKDDLRRERSGDVAYKEKLKRHKKKKLNLDCRL